jgi:polysaccharide biosynthesis transport protein
MNQSRSADGYGSEDASPGRGLADYWRWFLRRFWIFLITTTGGLLLGLYMYSGTPPTYQSVATIEVLRVKKDAADVDEEEKIRMSGGSEMLSTTEKLRLADLYVEAARSSLFLNREKVVSQSFRYPWQEPVQYSAADLTPEIVGGMMRGWISVRWRPDTALLDITAVHSDPEIARDALVGLLSAYEQSTQDKVAGSSNYALEYILETSTEIKNRMLALEQTVRLYNRCLELSEEVRAAERQIADMEKRYLPQWPALVEAKELRSILRGRFSTELEQVLRLSADEKAFWDGNEASIGSNSEEGKVDARIQLVSTRSSVLERELEAEQQIYDNLITKLKEGNISKGFASKQFDVVQAPTLPGGPIAPIKSKVLMKYGLGGAALGIGIIFLIGFLDPTTRTVDELEEVSKHPVIAALPASRNSNREGALALLGDAQSPAAEAVRSLRAGLTFLGTVDERRSFLITSAVPGEGKSWVAANLAYAFAAQGDRTLLIDADLRRPVQSEFFGYSKDSKGLADHLSQETSLKEIILQSEVSKNLFLLPAGSRSANPAELLAGRALQPFLEKLSEFFDRIIIDSAPLLPVSDSIPLSKLSQSVVLVTRMGKTPKGATRRAIRILTENRTQPVGIVANGLPKSRTKGSYGYYYSYQGGGGYGTYASKDSAKG